MARHPSRIQHIGQAHRVIDRGQPDAAIHRAHQHMAVIFQIVADFQDRRVLEQRLQHRDGIIESDLVIGGRRRIKREPPLPVRLDNGAAMAKRHIAGAPRGQRHRHTDHFSRRRVQRTGFGIHRQIALLARRRGPFLELGDRCDQLIADLAFGKRCRSRCRRGRRRLRRAAHRPDGRFCRLGRRADTGQQPLEILRLQERDQPVHVAFGALQLFQRQRHRRVVAKPYEIA